MSTRLRKLSPRSTFVVAVGILISIMAFATLLSGAPAPATNITIINNSSHEIRHVYLSAVDQNNWGSDQLVNSVIPSGGGSFTLSDVSCGASSIKVITEDESGCFLYKVVACSQATT